MYELIWKQFILAISLILSIPAVASSQITPDNTLEAESSVVNSVDELRQIIEGGAIRGENLFHSFEEFNVGENLEVYFANPETVNNIFSRVTGNEVSKILGTLGVEETANLFLFNPNGIIFGENVFIDVNGSFMASTAESIEFNGGKTFDARNSNSEPVLTWNAPIGLSFNNPGNIEVRGSNNNIVVEVPSFRVITEDVPVGIEIKPEQNVSLIGGDISFEGGGISAEGGNIQLGSVSDNQTVNLTEIERGWVASYEEVVEFQNISLQQGAFINASGDGAGAISIFGKKILIEDSSAILSNTILDSSNTSNSININASELVKISGNFDLESNSIGLISADVLPSSTGDGINIEINTDRLEILDGAEIRAVNFSDSNNVTGEININARQIEIAGIKPGNVEITEPAITDLAGGLNSLITNSTGSTGIESRNGSANHINVNTETLKILNGGSIKADTFNLGEAGNLNIVAKQIELVGINESFPSRGTGILTSLSPINEAEKNSGNINLMTETLQIIDGARIKTSREGIENISGAGNINIIANNIDLVGYSSLNTVIVSGIFTSTGISSTGDGGNITINTNALNVLDGARIQADSSGVGKAGNIEVTARQINLNGTREEAGLFVSGITTSVSSRNENDGGNIWLESARLIIKNGSQVRAIARGSGNGGNIEVRAGEIEVGGLDRAGAGRQSGFYTDSRAESGSGGNIEISSDRVFLNEGRLSASSESDFGGSIALDTDNVQLLNNSLISASAGQDGVGGNINIDAGTVLGINSDLVATAERGDGGNISIEAEDTLGIEEGKAIPNNGISEADASSDFGANGRIVFINPQSSLSDPLSLTREIAIENTEVEVENNCWNKSFAFGNRQIIYTGRGGFPATPDNFNDEQQYFSVPNPVAPAIKNDEDFSVWQPGDPLIQANSVRVSANGEIYLVAEMSPQSATSLFCKIENTIKTTNDQSD